MKIAWLTDIHLNFVAEPIIEALGKECARMAEAILITGDISEAKTLEPDLIKLRGYSGLPIYFVLGNHDFYGSGLVKTEINTSIKLAEEDGYVYLTYCEPIALSKLTCLVGDDGWYDGRNGTFSTSPMELWDFTEIEDLAKEYRPLGKTGLGRKIAELGDRAVHRARPKLEWALENYEHVIFATHVPPFDKSSWYKGKIGEPYSQPFFSSYCMGKMLSELALNNPDKRITVFCGHTHHYCVYKHAENLTVYTGSAEYRHPTIMSVLEVRDSALAISTYTD